MITDTLKQAAQALRDTKPELAAALEAIAERKPVAWRRKRPNGVWGYATAQADDDGTVALDAKWEPLYAAPIATPEQEPDGYIHPDNVRRLQTGETVAFRKKPYAHDGGGIPVFVGISIVTPEHDAQVRNAALEELAILADSEAMGSIDAYSIRALKTPGGAA